MSDVDNVKNKPDSVNKNFEPDLELAKIRDEVLRKYRDYSKTMAYMAADAPVEVLCLPKTLQNILLDNGFLRVYDLFDMDFTKIKGLGVVRARDLTTRLNEFLSML